jgi:hypothetical protein
VSQPPMGARGAAPWAITALPVRGRPGRASVAAVETLVTGLGTVVAAQVGRDRRRSAVVTQRRAGAAALVSHRPLLAPLLPVAVVVVVPTTRPLVGEALLPLVGVLVPLAIQRMRQPGPPTLAAAAAAALKADLELMAVPVLSSSVTRWSAVVAAVHQRGRRLIRPLITISTLSIATLEEPTPAWSSHTGRQHNLHHLLLQQQMILPIETLPLTRFMDSKADPGSC